MLSATIAIMNDTENKHRIKRLKFRANHRGIKEMDIILGKFADSELADLPSDLVDQFELLLNENDRDLLVWFTREKPFPHLHLKTIFSLICKMALNQDD